MNNNTHYNFLILGLVSLTLGVVFGLLASFQYMLPEFLKEDMPFSQLRELHVSMVISWIIIGATGGVYYYISKEHDRGLYSEALEKAHFWIFLITGLLIFLSITTNNMGGREYMTYAPILYFPIIIGWILFAINYYRTIFINVKSWPVYLWMWMTGIVFMIFTYTEAHLWLIPYFRDSVIRDITVQWKSYGSMVGSWNMLIYGTAIYIMSKIKGDDTVARGKLAFFFYFLGLTNLMFGWAHHTYIIPHQPWIRIVAYGISMTEWIIIGSMILNWSKSLKKELRQDNISYKWIISTDVWVFLNLILALLISIPVINLFTHGTHITVAHSMGTTIGINSTIIFASISYILLKDSNHLVKYKKMLNIGFFLFHFSLFIFLSSLIYAGYQRSIWMNTDLYTTQNFSEMHQSMLPTIFVLVFSGGLLCLGILFTTIPFISSFLKMKKTSQ